MLDSNSGRCMVIIGSNKRSFFFKRALIQAGVLNTNFCSPPGALIRADAAIRHWAVIRSFTVIHLIIIVFSRAEKEVRELRDKFARGKTPDLVSAIT